MLAYIFVGLTSGLIAFLFTAVSHFILRFYRTAKLIQKIPGPNAGLWNGLHGTTVDLPGPGKYNKNEILVKVGRCI